MPQVTLTFDNGPDPDVTPEVLRTLRRRGLKATFFVIGEKLRDGRHLAAMAHAEGHWIGNHTLNHPVPLGQCQEPGQATREIEETERLIGDLAHPRRFFRPFANGGDLSSGLLNREAVEHLRAARHTVMLWYAVPRDWLYPSTWIGSALDQCTVRPHTVLVLYDLPTGAMAQLDRFISLALETGLDFTQDFPADCMPIVSGTVVDDLRRYMVVPGPNGAG